MLLCIQLTYALFCQVMYDSAYIQSAYILQLKVELFFVSLYNRHYILSSYTAVLLVQIVVGRLEELKMKERQRRAGSRGPPSCCPSSAWCSSQRSMTGAKRSSSAGCRAASNKSRSFLWSVPGRSFRFLLPRLSLETLLL